MDGREHGAARRSGASERRAISGGCVSAGRARVLAQREVFDGFAEREEGLVDIGGLAQSGAISARLACVLGAREVDEVGARHADGRPARLQHVTPRLLVHALELVHVTPTVYLKREDAVRPTRLGVECVAGRVAQPQRLGERLERLCCRAHGPLAAADPVAPGAVGRRAARGGRLELERQWGAVRDPICGRALGAKAAALGSQQVVHLALVDLEDRDAQPLHPRLRQHARRVRRLCLGEPARRGRRGRVGGRSSRLGVRVCEDCLHETRHHTAIFGRLAADDGVCLARARLRSTRGCTCHRPPVSADPAAGAITARRGRGRALVTRGHGAAWRLRGRQP